MSKFVQRWVLCVSIMVSFGVLGAVALEPAARPSDPSPDQSDAIAGIDGLLATQPSAALGVTASGSATVQQAWIEGRRVEVELLESRSQLIPDDSADDIRTILFVGSKRFFFE